MNKICLICGKEFETIKYEAARKYCFECSPATLKNDNKSRAQAITAIRHALKNQLIKEAGGKCCKCGYNKYSAALEFHHLNPEEKEFSIGNFTSHNNVNIQQAKEEVKKCVLLCSNCHKEFHWLNDTTGIDYQMWLNN